MKSKCIHIQGRPGHVYLHLLTLLPLNIQQKINVNIRNSASLALRPPQHRVLAAEWKTARPDGKRKPEWAKGHSRGHLRTGSWRTATRRPVVPSVGCLVLKQWTCGVERVIRNKAGASSPGTQA